MYICICNGITDTKLKNLIDQGVQDVKGIQARCKAGNNCGTCLCEVKKMIKERKKSSFQGQNKFDLKKELT